AAIQHAAESPWTAARLPPPPELEKTVTTYGAEQNAIRDSATKLERERDAKSKEADLLLEHHHALARAVAMFQVAIALGAVSALTRQRLVWAVSLLLGLAGAVMFAQGLLGS